MPGINFLDNKKEDKKKEKKASDKSKHKIEWSKPEKLKSIASDRASSLSNKRKPIKWSSFFKKEKDSTVPAKNEIIDKPIADKIKSSRKEILKSIKEEKLIKKATKKDPPATPEPSDGGRGKKQKIKSNRFNFSVWLKSVFKKNRSDDKNLPASLVHAGQAGEKKESLKEYKQVFKNVENIEKIIKDSNKKEVTQATPPTPAPEPSKPDKDNSQILIDEKKLALSEVKAKKKKIKFSLLDKLKLFFKNNKSKQVKKEDAPKSAIEKRDDDLPAQAGSHVGKKEKLDEDKIKKIPNPPTEKRDDDMSAQAGSHVGKKVNQNNKKWERAEILETNLIKEEIAAFFDWKKGITKLVIFTVFAISLVVVGHRGVLIWSEKQKAQVAGYNSKINNTNKEIEPLEEYVKEVLIFQKKLRLVASLLDQHIYWTNFFKFLEDNTTPEVYYAASFSGDTNGSYSLAAKAKSFRGVLDQVNAMRLNEDIISVNAGGGSVSSSEDGEQLVNFQLDFSINPTLFIK